MSGETLFVSALIGVAAALMASNRIRIDVALFLVAALITGMGMG